MRKVHVYHNGPGAHGRTIRWKIGHLPVRQTLIWLGPWFIHIHP